VGGGGREPPPKDPRYRIARRGAGREEIIRPATFSRTVAVLDAIIGTRDPSWRPLRTLNAYRKIPPGPEDKKKTETGLLATNSNLPIFLILASQTSPSLAKVSAPNSNRSPRLGLTLRTTHFPILLHPTRLCTEQIRCQ
jgi:hypothetical protein